MAGQLSIGGVAHQAQHTFLASLRQLLDIKGFPIDGGVVKLKVTGVNHNAHGGVNNHRAAVGNGVGVANVLD